MILALVASWCCATPWPQTARAPSSTSAGPQNSRAGCELIATASPRTRSAMPPSVGFACKTPLWAATSEVARAATCFVLFETQLSEKSRMRILKSAEKLIPPAIAPRNPAYSAINRGRYLDWSCNFSASPIFLETNRAKLAKQFWHFFSAFFRNPHWKRAIQKGGPADALSLLLLLITIELQPNTNTLSTSLT